MNYPEYIEVSNKKYKINTDFRVAIECNRIAQDETIGNFERSLAIIYMLLGEQALNDFNNHDKILKLIRKYLLCNKEYKSEGIPDMDFEEDMDYIEASFMSDYHIDLTNTNMHWWKFWNLMNGLSNSELGNCCVLNNIRNLRNFDVTKIKDDKERQKILKAKEDVALKKYKKENNITEEQQKSMDELNKLLNL